MELRAKDLRYTVQHSDCRKSGAKVAKKKLIANKIYQKFNKTDKYFQNISTLILL